MNAFRIITVRASVYKYHLTLHFTARTFQSSRMWLPVRLRKITDPNEIIRSRLNIWLPVVHASTDRIMEGPVVTVNEGQLKGTVIESSLGKPYIAFKGIPFAAPPLGELRFKDPQPPAAWSGVRDASKYGGDICAQVDDYPPYQIIGGEDCLYLNVYTTSINKTKPVMFWIHGGAFISGSGTDYFIKPDYLVDKDVLLVTINYRLGALGFLNVGHEVAAGNQGFKDQVAALRWVKENIAVFGGDPDDVTIFGASAGGASVHALCMSPMARGLFHKAILESGVALHPWSLNRSRPERCIKLAELLGNSTTDPVEVVKFLRTVPVRDLVEAQMRIPVIDKEKDGTGLPFALAVDSVSKNPFFPHPVEEVLEADSEIPIMIGYTSHEFIMFLRDPSEENLRNLYNNMEDFVRTSVPNVHSSNISKLTEDIKNYYFGVNDTFKLTPENVIDALGDLYFVKDINAVADNRRQRAICAKTYLYQFSYVGDEETVTEAMLQKPRVIRGASHVDEMSYLFYMPRAKVNNTAAPAVGTKDRITIERMTGMWSNFAKTGNPTPSTNEFITTIWEPATKDEFYYLDIDDDLKVKVIGKTVADLIEKYT